MPTCYSHPIKGRGHLPLSQARHAFGSQEGTSPFYFRPQAPAQCWALNGC